MEETLTRCLVNIRDDLKELHRIREYLDSKSQSQVTESCSMTWQTVEIFNSILSACASQDIPDAQALEILLDSFYYIATHNDDKNSWNNFGFELGIISVKIISAIEQTEMFNSLFCKLLTVINIICEYNSNVWKAVARQILNVFINKKFSFSYLEAILKLYICILRNVKSSDLYCFAQQNLHLLRTLSMLVQGIGDFEAQTDIMELIFLHVMNNKKLIENFFVDSKNQTSALLNKLQFSDFEGDCRVFLNQLNKNLGSDRKVFTISCHKLYLGGCSLQPPLKKPSIWVDANKDSRRLSIKCANFQSDSDDLVSKCVIYIHFQDIISIKLEYGTMSETSCYCVTLDTRNLDKMFKAVKNSEVVCIALETENSQDVVLEFINFLENMIKQNHVDTKTSKRGERMSQTCDEVSINRNEILGESNELSSELQNSAISSSVNDKFRFGINKLIPDVLSLFEKVKNKSNIDIKLNESKKPEEQKFQNPSRYVTSDELVITTPALKENILSRHTFTLTQNQNTKDLHPRKISELSKDQGPQNSVRDEMKENIVLETQELTPNSFIESLNKNLGIDNQEIKSSFDETIEKMVTSQVNISSEKKRHKLFKNPEEIFDFTKEEDDIRRNLNIFKESWENKENVELKEKFEIFPEKFQNSNMVKRAQKLSTTSNVLQDKINLIDLSSQNYFREDINNPEIKKKPSLPRLKRIGRTRKKTEKEVKVINPSTTKRKSKFKKEDSRKELNLVWTSKKLPSDVTFSTTKPSLLDPNGYAYQRWKMPATSERSKFWINKLNSVKKEKSHSSSVFDFSEDSEREIKNEISKQKKVLKAAKEKVNKPKKRNLRKKLASLQEIKNILKTVKNTKLGDLTSENKINNKLETTSENSVDPKKFQTLKKRNNSAKNVILKNYHLRSLFSEKNTIRELNKNDNHENQLSVSKRKTKEKVIQNSKSGTKKTHFSLRKEIQNTNTEILEMHSPKNVVKNKFNEKIKKSTKQNFVPKSFSKNDCLKPSKRNEKPNIPLNDHTENYILPKESKLQNYSNTNKNGNIKQNNLPKRNGPIQMGKSCAKNASYNTHQENKKIDFPISEHKENKEQPLFKNNSKPQNNINKSSTNDLKLNTTENYNQYNPTDDSKKTKKDFITGSKRSNRYKKSENRETNFLPNELKQNKKSNTSEEGILLTHKKLVSKSDNLLRPHKSGDKISKTTKRDIEDNIDLLSEDITYGKLSKEFVELNTSPKSRVQKSSIPKTEEDEFNNLAEENSPKDEITKNQEITSETNANKNILITKIPENANGSQNRGEKQNFWKSVGLQESTEHRKKTHDSSFTSPKVTERVKENTKRGSKLLNIKSNRSSLNNLSDGELVEECSKKSADNVDNSVVDMDENLWKALGTSYGDDTNLNEKHEKSSCISDNFENNQSFIYDNIIRQRSGSDETINEPGEIHLSLYDKYDTNFSKAEFHYLEGNEVGDRKKVSDLELSSGDEIIEEETTTKKRERSEEESSSAKIRTKKKTKRVKEGDSELLRSIVKLRLEKLEHRIKQQTDDIIEVVNRATNQLYNHIHRKEMEGVRKYLTTAERVCSGLNESTDLEDRAKRIKRVMAYYEAGCSVSDHCEFIDNNFSEIRQSLEGFVDNNKNTFKKIDLFSGRLKTLIKSNIEEMIREEIQISRTRLRKLKSTFKYPA